MKNQKLTIFLWELFPANRKEEIVALFWRKEHQEKNCARAVETLRNTENSLDVIYQYAPLERPEHQLYKQIRLLIPIIDAAIGKIIRLMGEFDVTCENHEAEKDLNLFLKNVSVSGTGMGIYAFLKAYMDDLLLYGNAVGEIVLTESGEEIFALYNAPVDHIVAKQMENGVEVALFKKEKKGLRPIEKTDQILFTALNPRSGEIVGRPILEGLPFISNILLKIYSATEKNFERVGNVRFAVTYRPGSGASEKAYAKERAEVIAREWSSAMRSDQVKDFVAVGDVDIKVIGADNQTLDTQIPVRQMLEQIVAKLGIPPYLLGLSWSTSERMSTAQADILTSELMSYQRVLTPVISHICRLYLRLHGYGDEPVVEWQDINLLDEVEGANARYLKAKAMQIERQFEKEDALAQ